MRVIFMGTPDIAVPTLNAIVEAGHEVVLVVSQPDKAVGRSKALKYTAVKACALEHGIEVYQPERIRAEESVEYAMRQSYLLEQVIKSPEHSQGIDYLLRANEARIAYLKKHYANLTEVDIQVLILIGMGLETQDILLILDMSKRTYYKRRQIISKRMSISTTELDEKAQLLFNSKY